MCIRDRSEKGLLEVSHTLQAETYYNHFNMQKLSGGGGYGGTEKGNSCLLYTSIFQQEICFYK